MIDFPYIILILILFIALWVSNKTQLYKKRIFIISCVIVYIFIAFRAQTVGADTNNYVNFFIGKTKEYNSDQRELEPLLLLYNHILQIISNGAVFYLMANTFFSLSPIYYLIKHYSCNRILSIILFFILGYYTTYFVALRQILSMALIFYGFILYQKNEENKIKWGVFILFSILAYFMHTSAIIVSVIFIATFLINNVKKKIYTILIISSFIIGYVFRADFYMTIFAYISGLNISYLERLDSYLNADLSFEEMSIVTLLLPNIMALVYLKYINPKHLNHNISKLYLLGTILNNIFMFFVFIQRLVIPFQIFSIIALTWPLSYKKKYYYKLTLIIFIFLFAIRYIKSNINPDLNDKGVMHPYTWFFEQ